MTTARHTFTLFAALLAILLLAACNSTFKHNGVSYSPVDGGVEVVANNVREYVGTVTIPDSVEHKGAKLPVVGIAADAFRDNKLLTRVLIPGTVARIGSHAFSGCQGLKEVHLQAQVPVDVDTTSFAGIEPGTVVLYVPLMAAKGYAATPGWHLFAIREEGELHGGSIMPMAPIEEPQGEFDGE